MLLENNNKIKNDLGCIKYEAKRSKEQHQEEENLINEINQNLNKHQQQIKKSKEFRNIEENIFNDFEKAIVYSPLYKSLSFYINENQNSIFTMIMQILIIWIMMRMTITMRETMEMIF